MTRFPLLAGLLALGVMVSALFASWWQSAKPGGSSSAEISYFCKLQALNHGDDAARARAQCLAQAEPRYLVVGFAIGLALLAVAVAAALRRHLRTPLPPNGGSVAA